MDCSLPGFSVHGIFQARVLEWVAISFSRGSPNPGTEPRSPALQADTLPSEPSGKPLLSGGMHQLDFAVGSSGKELAYQRKRCKRHKFDPWVRKIP